MYISDGSSTKKFTLYPLAKMRTKVESEVWIDDDNEDFHGIQPIFTLSKIDEEDELINLIKNNDSSRFMIKITVFKNKVILNIFHLIKCLEIFL